MRIREDNLSRPASAGPFMRRESPERNRVSRKIRVHQPRSAGRAVPRRPDQRRWRANETDGIETRAGKGAVVAAGVRRLDFGGQEASGFMTQWTETAENYGRVAASVNPGSKASSPCKLRFQRVRHPKLRMTPASDPEEGAWKIRGTIPPSSMKSWRAPIMARRCRSGVQDPLAGGLCRRDGQSRVSMHSLSQTADELKSSSVRNDGVGSRTSIPNWQLQKEGLTREISLPDRRACASFWPR